MGEPIMKLGAVVARLAELHAELGDVDVIVDGDNEHADALFRDGAIERVSVESAGDERAVFLQVRWPRVGGAT